MSPVYVNVPRPPPYSQPHLLQLARPQLRSRNDEPHYDHHAGEADGVAAGVQAHLVSGYRAAAIDLTAGVFVAERDFLIWLLLHNVTVCDLGGDITSMLFKGEVALRPHVVVDYAQASCGLL